MTFLRGISEEVAQVLRGAGKKSLKRVHCSVKWIKDKRKKDYLHALANIDFFPERGFFS